MKKLFEIPELFTLEGKPFTGEEELYPLSEAFGEACDNGCEVGCHGGCAPGMGANDWI